MTGKELLIMNEIILLKLGELVLKGLNRRSFEDKLQANIHRRLHPFGQFKVYTCLLSPMIRLKPALRRA